MKKDVDELDLDDDENTYESENAEEEVKEETYEDDGEFVSSKDMFEDM